MFLSDGLDQPECVEVMVMEVAGTVGGALVYVGVRETAFGRDLGGFVFSREKPARKSIRYIRYCTWGGGQRVKHTGYKPQYPSHISGKRRRAPSR